LPFQADSKEFLSLHRLISKFFIISILTKIFRFYYDGFRGMTVGRKLWIIILVKLFILFAILKVFFFPDILKTRFSNDRERGDYVIEQLSKKP
jgi:hypothetical protein